MSKPPVSQNKIAYINPQGQLCTIDPAGTSYKLLTASKRKRIFRFPAWSPDGRHLAVIGRSKSSAGVFVLPNRSSDPSEIAETDVPRALHICDVERPFYLYWSPDSTSISFLAAHPHGLGLHLIGSDGQAHRLLTTGQPCFWDWTPSGHTLITHTGGNSSDARLEFINIHSTDKNGGATHPGMFQTPVIAPSGQHWAFAQQDSSEQAHIVVASCTNTTRFTVAHTGAVALGWCPTQDMLAFTCPVEPARHFYGPLYLLDPERQMVRTLAYSMVLAFFWSPDGRSIAYITLANEFQKIAPIPGTFPYPNGNGNGNGHKDTQHSPRQDYTYIRPLHQHDPLLRLWVVDVENGKRRLLKAFQASEEFLTQFMPFFDQYALSHRIWSPNSDALVIPVQAEQQAQVLVVPINGESPYVVAEGNMAFWSP